MDEKQKKFKLSSAGGQAVGLFVEIRGQDVVSEIEDIFGQPKIFPVQERRRPSTAIGTAFVPLQRRRLRCRWLEIISGDAEITSVDP